MRRKTVKAILRLLLNLVLLPFTLVVILAGAFAWAYDTRDIGYWEFMKETGAFDW